MRRGLLTHGNATPMPDMYLPDWKGEGLVRIYDHPKKYRYCQRALIKRDRFQDDLS